MCVVGNIGMEAAVFVANRIRMRMMANTYHIQVAAELWASDYMANVRREIDCCAEVCRGANTRDITPYQQCLVARLLNASGYHYGRWYHHVHAYEIEMAPQSQSPPRATEDPEHSMDASTLHEIAEAHRCLRIRMHPRNRALICAMYVNGGCTTTFASLEELARWAVMEFTGEWREDLRIEGSPRPRLPMPESDIDDADEDGENWQLAEFARKALLVLPDVAGTATDILGTSCNLHRAATWPHLMVGLLAIYNVAEVNVQQLMGRLVTFMFNMNTVTKTALEEGTGVDPVIRAFNIGDDPSQWGQYIDLVCLASLFERSLIVGDLEDLDNGTIHASSTIYPVNRIGLQNAIAEPIPCTITIDTANAQTLLAIPIV